jgi:hypothetical protein
MAKGDKIVPFFPDSRATTALRTKRKIKTVDSGNFDWGGRQTKRIYQLRIYSFLKVICSASDWLRQWVKDREERDEVNIRSFQVK